MPVYPVSDDDHIGAALNVARNPDPMGDAIQAKIGGLNQALTGLDLEANTPNFHTGIGGAGMPSRAVPSRPSNTGEDLFDYSRLHEIPNVPQIDLERYVPTRGVPVRVQDVMANKDVKDKMLQTIKEGQEKGGANWYNADPLRDKFIENLGADAGDKAFRKYMDMVAATSPRSDVGTNVRNASYYYQRAMAGESMPEVGTPNPQPYGHMAQRLHQMNAQRVAGEGWDALNNPKPASFVENLVGNQAPVTVDTHAFRLPAIHAADPRFLETAFQVNKDAPKQNIQKMVTSGEMPLDEALGRAAYWQAQPKENEYGAMEQYYKSLGQELGLSPAQTQASAWVGGGKLTGLASDESKPFLRFFQDRIYKTANELKMDPNDVMDRFIKGEMTLRASGGRTLGNNAIDNALRLATGGRAHFDDGGDAGGDVRGGDNPGGYSGDTGRFSGNQDAANNFRKGDSPGGFGGDTGRYSSHDVGAEQGAINAQTARDQAFQQSQRQAQENNAAGYALRTGDVPGGIGGDTGRYSGYTSPQQGQQDAITATLQGNIQRARQQQQQAFDKYMSQLQGPESGGQGSAYNATTGAFGAYQLMPKTALGLMQKYAPGETYRLAEGTSNPADVAGGGLNTGPGYVGLTPQEQLRNVTLNQDLQRTLAEGLTRDNMATFSNAGVPINSGSLYTAHLLGAGDALKVLQSDPNTPLEQIGINPQAITNNNLSGMTAGQLLARSGSQMAAAPAGGISSAGGYGRLAENTADNSGARINDVSGSPDAAITAAKTSASTQQPSILERIFGSNADQIAKLEQQGQYSGMDRDQYTAAFSPDNPDAVKARIINDNGQQKVDYYTKDLGQAVFGDAGKALTTGLGNLFAPKSSYDPTAVGNGMGNIRGVSPGYTSGPFDRAGRNQQAINDAMAVAAPAPAPAGSINPFTAELSSQSLQLPSTTGLSAQDWANQNTGGDMSKVHARIKYINGAPRLEYYTV